MARMVILCVNGTVLKDTQRTMKLVKSSRALICEAFGLRRQGYVQKPVWVSKQNGNNPFECGLCSSASQFGWDAKGEGTLNLSS